MPSENPHHIVVLLVLCVCFSYILWEEMYILLVFLGLGMVLVIVAAPGHREFSVESGTCLHIANLGPARRYKGGGLAQQCQLAWLTTSLCYSCFPSFG